MDISGANPLLELLYLQMTVKSWMYFAMEYQDYVQTCEAQGRFYCLEQWMDERDDGSEQDTPQVINPDEFPGKTLFIFH